MAAPTPPHSGAPLLPPHGGYRNLKSFRLAQLVYDITVRFCERYLDRRSRTVDQMTQAARSGTQNIAEGSVASGTSKKTELKLTNVARASLEELRLDYEDFLRQRELPLWPPDHPALTRFRALRCDSLEALRAWVEDERGRAKVEKAHGHAPTGTDEHDTYSVSVGDSPCPCVCCSAVPPSSAYVANAALSLLNLCCHLLDRQLAAQGDAFQREGGFTERLYRIRSEKRKK
jgi:four helix bundle suffix protein